MGSPSNQSERVRIGILRESKNPPDRRVPLTPSQCRELMERYPRLEIIVQPSWNRCFTDEEYRLEGIELREDLSECQVLLGVKEVDTRIFMNRKTYLFFSHTAKKQPYNRGLLQKVVEQGITLIDYEYLTGKNRERVVAFGRWAGIVGAYHGLRAYGLRQQTFTLKPASECRDLQELLEQAGQAHLQQGRILVTGGGRVAGGALEILHTAGIREVTPEQYLKVGNGDPVFTRLDPWHYTERKEGGAFSFEHFVAHPEEYDNAIHRYARVTDMLIACHFWDPRSPLMLTRDDLADPSHPVRIIADVSCDINGPIASTIRASTIKDPYYGYDPSTGREKKPFDPDSITVMAVDNLPGELPRDASEDFGNALIRNFFPELAGEKDTGMIQHATIVKEGKLTVAFGYLKDYLEGKE